MTLHQISLHTSGDLLLQVPNGHAVRVPMSLDGLRIIRRILQSRQRDREAKIARPAAPTQYMVDAWLKSANEAAKLEVDEIFESLEFAL